jgi:hypothetical protein
MKIGHILHDHPLAKLKAEADRAFSESPEVKLHRRERAELAELGNKHRIEGEKLNRDHLTRRVQMPKPLDLDKRLDDERTGLFSRHKAERWAVVEKYRNAVAATRK